jgi:hypothetical protein
MGARAHKSSAGAHMLELLYKQLVRRFELVVATVGNMSQFTPFSLTC